MAGPRKASSLPAKKPKVKAARPATVPKPSLSSEFVVDSDDSGDAKTAGDKKPASKTASAGADVVKPAEPKPSASQGKPSKKRKLPSSSPEEDDSGGSGSGNDGSSEDEQRPSNKRIVTVPDESPTPMPKPATARPVSAKTSSANVKPLNQNKERGSGATSEESGSEAGYSSGDSSSGSESGSGSGSGSGNESISGSSDKTSLQSPEKSSPVQKSVPQQPAPTYKPPAGFEHTSISFHPASKLSEILAPSNLQGKQIWHITVPESVPISLVKEVSTQDIGNGAPIVEHHGAKYGLVPESGVEQSSSRALLLPSTQTNSYQSSKTNIIKTLHLQQLVSLPSLASEPAVHPSGSPSAPESYRKTPRQQPEGLRMRYRPFGASDDSTSESSPKPAPKAPEFRLPASVKESSPGRKRKRSESGSNAVSAVKSKKRKQSPPVTAGATRDPMDIDATSDKSSDGEMSPAKNSHPKTNGIRPNGNLPNGTETKDERRKRKEKKKLEKRESPPKPATALPLDVKQDAETMQPGEVVEGAPTIAIANAVEGTTSINGLSAQIEPNHQTARREDKRRRRKEKERTGRGASLIPGDNTSQRVHESPDQMMQEIENAQRDASVQIQISSPRERSALKQSGSAHVSRNRTLDSGRDSSRKETEEERAKRKEEKRRRRTEGRNA